MSLVISQFDTKQNNTIKKLLEIFNSLVPGTQEDEFFVKILTESSMEVVFKMAKKKNALVRKSFCKEM